MITLKIQGKEYNIKSSWEEVSFKDFINIIYLNEDKGFSNLAKTIKTISLLSDSSELEALLFELSIEDFSKLQAAFAWMQEEIKYDSTKKTFEVDGNKYTIKSNFTKLTVGEMISLETILKDKNIDKHPFEVAFAVLFRKLDAEGKETEFNEEDFLFNLTELPEKVKAVDVMQHINFFLNIDKTSITNNSKESSFQIVMNQNSLECQKKKLKSTKKKKNKTS